MEAARTTRCRKGLGECMQLGKHTDFQPKRRDHPATAMSIYTRRVRLVNNQVGIARREDLVYAIDRLWSGALFRPYCTRFQPEQKRCSQPPRAQHTRPGAHGALVHR